MGIDGVRVCINPGSEANSEAHHTEADIFRFMAWDDKLVRSLT